eukprot:15450502-Alexandrium_andersonii.AAC.1
MPTAAGGGPGRRSREACACRPRRRSDCRRSTRLSSCTCTPAPTVSIFDALVFVCRPPALPPREPREA